MQESKFSSTLTVGMENGVALGSNPATQIQFKCVHLLSQALGGVCSNGNQFKSPVSHKDWASSYDFGLTRFGPSHEDRVYT
jgi:hypothetical protein